MIKRMLGWLLALAAGWMMLGFMPVGLQAQAAKEEAFTLYLPLIENSETNLIFIPAGEFEMGCDPEHNFNLPCTKDNEPTDETPLHTVFLHDYLIQRTEVTNAQYAACVADGDCTIPHQLSSYSRSDYYASPDFADYPVIYVNWYQADAYCHWAGGRLPTEAEWEKAARGSTPIAYPWGDAGPNCSLANSWDEAANVTCNGDTAQVGSYPAGASAYGVLDLSGNVWEWVNDWYAFNYYEDSPEVNPTGPLTGENRAMRGGGWYCFWNDIRTGNRHQFHPLMNYYNMGFRCVVDVP